MHATQLGRIPLFRHLSSRRLAALCAKAQLERYDKGAALFHQGERAQAVWIVLKGWVHLVRSAHPNDLTHAVVIFTITPQEVLCGISSIDAGVYHLSAVAGTACRAVRIPAEAFNDALRHEPGFAYHALRLYARRVQHIAQQYGSMAEPVAHRLIRTVLRLRQQFGSTLPVTHRELAQMSWTTTESAIRIVRRLKRRGYLDGTRGRLTIAKAGALGEILKRSNAHEAL